MNGVDVSRWNGTIDWRRVRAAGMEFAMLRAGTGRRRGDGFTADPKFAENLAGAVSAGISCGAYLYSYADSTEAARREAEGLADFILPHRAELTFPVAYDIERTSQAGLGRETCTEMANAFCEVIREAGFVPMVYSFKSFLQDSLDAEKLTADVWLAHFARETDYRGAYTIRQYSDCGEVDGITGKVDLNRAGRDYAVPEGTEEAIRTLAESGRMTSPDYWRAAAAGRITAERGNIAALLRKWAACIGEAGRNEA